MLISGCISRIVPILLLDVPKQSIWVNLVDVIDLETQGLLLRHLQLKVKAFEVSRFLFQPISALAPLVNAPP